MPVACVHCAADSERPWNWPAVRVPFLAASASNEFSWSAASVKTWSSARSERTPVAARLAPRLRMGDRAIYISIKDRWDDSVHEDCWKLVAALQVVDQPPSHIAAATWYRERGLPLPSNLLVEGNPPETWERTSQRIRPKLRDRVGDPCAHPDRTVRLWDAGYHQRAREDPGVSICQVIARSLWSPPTVRVTDFVSLMGKEPSTRNPPRIPPDVADALVAHLHAAGDV